MAKNRGPILTFDQLGGITGVPPEFIAAMELTETVQKVPNTVDPDALSDTVFFSRIETNQTGEREKHTYFKKAGNITLSAIRTNNEGRPVQVTRTLFPTGTTPTEPTATTEVAIHDLGNGWSIQEVSVEGTYVAGVFTPGVFPETRIDDTGAAAQLDRAIQHFFVNYKSERIASVAAGTTATPTALAQPTTLGNLATGIGVVEATAERVDGNKVRNTDTTVSAASLTSLAGVELDEESGTVKDYTQEVVVAGAAGSSVASNGTYSEVKPVNARFSIKTTRKATNFSSRSYTTREYVGNLPGVLTIFTPYVFTARSRRAPYGNASTSNGLGPNLDPNYIHPAGDIISAGFHVEITYYNKDYDVAVVEQWQSTLWTGLATATFSPTAFSWTTPFGSGQVPACLHDTYNISYSTGTTHLTYQSVSGNIVIPVTTPVSLSGSTVIQDSQRWYNNGFLRTTKTITI